MINRAVTTKAVRSVRLRSSAWGLTRQDLNVKQLVEILKYGHILDLPEEDAQCIVKNGKKRTAPNHICPRKRAKANLKAPSAAQSTPEADPLTKTIQVYSHSFELGYTCLCEDPSASDKYFVDDELASEIGWLQEETELIDILATESNDANVIQDFDIGEVTIGEDKGVLQLFHKSHPTDDRVNHLLTLPTVAFSDGSGYNEMLSTCWSLQHSGHVSMSPFASLVYIPGLSRPNLPIQIKICISVSIVIPKIFFPPALYVAPSASIEDKRRRFLSHVICPRLQEGFSTQQSGEEASIRHFYSILKPAPPVSSSIIYDALQPEGLRAVLLPFQRRRCEFGQSYELCALFISCQFIA